MIQELEYFIGLVSKQLNEEEVSSVLSWLDTADISKLKNDHISKNTTDRDLNALEHAAKNGYKSIVEKLVKKGFNPLDSFYDQDNLFSVNSVTDMETQNRPITSIHLAIKYNHFEIFKVLWNSVSSELNYAYELDYLSYAAAVGCEQIVCYLVEEEDIKIQNIEDELISEQTRNGRSECHSMIPTLMAAANGQVPILRYLMKRGADTEYTLDYGLGDACIDVMSAALERSQLPIVRFLVEEKGWEFEKNPIVNALSGHKTDAALEIVEYLKCLGFTIHTTNFTPTLRIDEEVFPIHQAVLSNNPDFVRYCLQEGANPNQLTSDDNFTPLYLAVGDRGFSVSAEIVELLMVAGSNPNILSQYGHNDMERTPLGQAITSLSCLEEIKNDEDRQNIKSNTHKIIFKLIAKGARIDFENEDWNTYISEHFSTALKEVSTQSLCEDGLRMLEKLKEQSIDKNILQDMIGEFNSRIFDLILDIPEIDPKQFKRLKDITKCVSNLNAYEQALKHAQINGLNVLSKDTEKFLPEYQVLVKNLQEMHSAARCKLNELKPYKEAFSSVLCRSFYTAHATLKSDAPKPDVQVLQNSVLTDHILDFFNPEDSWSWTTEEKKMGLKVFDKLAAQAVKSVQHQLQEIEKLEPDQKLPRIEPIGNFESRDDDFAD